MSSKNILPKNKSTTVTPVVLRAVRAMKAFRNGNLFELFLHEKYAEIQKDDLRLHNPFAGDLLISTF